MNDDIDQVANTQTVTNTVAHPVVQELREKVASLPPEKRHEAESVIDQIEGLIDKGPPALKTVTLLIEDLVEYWPSAVPWLASQADQIRLLLGG